MLLSHMYHYMNYDTDNYFPYYFQRCVEDNLEDTVLAGYPENVVFELRNVLSNNITYVGPDADVIINGYPVLDDAFRDTIFEEEDISPLENCL